MKEVTLIKALSNFVLFFAILDYVVVYICNISAGGLVYIMLGLLTLIICFFVRRSNEVNYYESIDEFKRGLIFITVILGISIFANSFNTIENVLVPCIIIYIVTSVVLLRTLRYMQYNENNRYLNKINIAYSAFAIILSIILSIKIIRESIIKVLLQAYNIVINVVLFFISWILFGLGYLIEFMVVFMRKLLMGIKLNQASAKAQESPYANMKEIKRTDLISALLNNKLVIFLIQAAVILLIVYIILKLFRRRTFFYREEEEYAESKEFLGRDKEHMSLRRFSSIFRPKTYTQYIRYYYEKFLKLCLEKKIDIKYSDTTLEIEEKSRQHFHAEIISEMRNIYIGARYNEENGDKKTMNAFYNYYKKLKRDSKT